MTSVEMYIPEYIY